MIPVRCQTDNITPLVDMNEYKSYQRILDCWQCFQAKGRMCVDKHYAHMMSITKSSNQGYGVCCRPDTTEGLCNPLSEELACSMPSYDNDKTSKYSKILS